MGHGLQLIEEIPVGNSTKWIIVGANSTVYVPLTNASMWDTVHGIRFFLSTHWVDGGGGSLTITVEGANEPNATSWATISTAAVTPAAGTAVAPTQSQFEVAPLVSAAASRFTSLPPFIRVKFVTNATAVAAIQRVARTIRGLT